MQRKSSLHMITRCAGSACSSGTVWSPPAYPHHSGKRWVSRCVARASSGWIYNRNSARASGGWWLSQLNVELAVGDVFFAAALPELAVGDVLFCHSSARASGGWCWRWQVLAPQYLRRSSSWLPSPPARAFSGAPGTSWSPDTEEVRNCPLVRMSTISKQLRF